MPLQLSILADYITKLALVELIPDTDSWSGDQTDSKNLAFGAVLLSRATKGRVQCIVEMEGSTNVADSS